MKGEPLKALTQGERIEGRLLAEVALWNAALLPLALAALGCLAFKSRELACGD